MNYQLEGITVLSYSSFAPLTGRGWISSLAVARWSRKAFWLNAHSRIFLRKLKIYLNMFFLCILFLVRVRHLGLHNNIIMNAIVLGKHVRRTSFIQPKPSSLLAATPYHVIPCNFLLLFYSSIYSVYSWFFLINLKTGIGQSKYCLRQPFSRCLISLCSGLFDFLKFCF